MTIDKILGVPEQAPDVEPPAEDAYKKVCAKYDKQVDDEFQAKCYILAFMNKEFQKQHEHMIHVADMIFHFRELYGDDWTH